MNLPTRVALVCFLAFHACDANKYLPRGHYRGLSRRQDSDPPTCNPCILPPLSEMPPAIDFLNILRQIVQEAKGNFQTIFDYTFENAEELKAAIRQNLENIQQATEYLIDEISQKLGNTESCPPLETLFQRLREQFDSFLSGLTTNFDQSVTNADRETLYAALAEAMAPDIHLYLVLIRDLLIYCVDIYLTDACEEIAPVIILTLDPNGIISQALSSTLSEQGSDAVVIVKNILGSLLPGEDGGVLDYIHIFVQLLCGSVKAVNPGMNISDITGGFCPNVSENSDYMSVVRNILCGIAAGLQDTGLPSETQQFCTNV